MAKPTPTKEEQGFVYKLGQDVAKLGFEIEKLKSKSVKAMRVTVPARPEDYNGGDLIAKVSLPDEYQHMICIKSRNNEIELIKTGETLEIAAEYREYEFYLAPVYKLNNDAVNATFDPEIVAEIEKIKRDALIYKYLAKYLTDNYLTQVRNDPQVQEYIGALNVYNANVYVNKNGLDALLAKPFEINIQGVELPKYNEEAKSAIKTELDNINAGRVDLSSASNFEIENYLVDSGV